MLMDTNKTNSAPREESAAAKTTEAPVTPFLFPESLPRMVQDERNVHILLTQEQVYEAERYKSVILQSGGLLSKITLSDHFGPRACITLQIGGKNITTAKRINKQWVFDFSQIHHESLIRQTVNGEPDDSSPFIDVTYCDIRFHFNDPAYVMPPYFRVTYTRPDWEHTEERWPYDTMTLHFNGPAAWLDFYADAGSRGTVKVYINGCHFRDVPINSRLRLKLTDVLQCLGYKPGVHSEDSLQKLKGQFSWPLLPHSLQEDTVNLTYIDRITVVPQGCTLLRVVCASYQSFGRDTLLPVCLSQCHGCNRCSLRRV